MKNYNLPSHCEIASPKESPQRLTSLEAILMRRVAIAFAQTPCEIIGHQAMDSIRHCGCVVVYGLAVIAMLACVSKGAKLNETQDLVTSNNVDNVSHGQTPSVPRIKTRLAHAYIRVKFRVRALSANKINFPNVASCGFSTPFTNCSWEAKLDLTMGQQHPTKLSASASQD